MELHTFPLHVLPQIAPFLIYIFTAVAFGFISFLALIEQEGSTPLGQQSSDVALNMYTVMMLNATHIILWDALVCLQVNEISRSVSFGNWFPI